MSRSLCVACLLVLWFDILHAIAELNRASHCIAVNSDYFLVTAVWKTNGENIS